jgi:hypothetical protein
VNKVCKPLVDGPLYDKIPVKQMKKKVPKFSQKSAARILKCFGSPLEHFQMFAHRIKLQSEHPAPGPQPEKEEAPSIEAVILLHLLLLTPDP